MGCSCHINPPCSYCMEKVECVGGCGEMIHPDEAFYEQTTADDEYGPFCKECFNKFKNN